MNSDMEKNLLLENYKDLLVEYHDSMEVYQSMLNEDVEQTTIKCSQIYGYNKAGVVTRWALYDLNGQLLFISDRHPKNELYTLNLTKLNLLPNTKFRFKAVVSSGSDSTAKEILEYDSSSKMSVYYRLTGTAFDTTLHFDGTIPNNI